MFFFLRGFSSAPHSCATCCDFLFFFCDFRDVIPEISQPETSRNSSVWCSGFAFFVGLFRSSARSSNHALALIWVHSSAHTIRPRRRADMEASHNSRAIARSSLPEIKITQPPNVSSWSPRRGGIFVALERETKRERESEKETKSERHEIFVCFANWAYRFYSILLAWTRSFRLSGVSLRALPRCASALSF